ncbi:MAG: hypothetical protein M1831_007074 [Alyxoria varia]|nr:MAG: hypothetical protein M1831_007074 [Alyxoria varia]
MIWRGLWMSRDEDTETVRQFVSTEIVIPALGLLRELFVTEHKICNASPRQTPARYPLNAMFPSSCGLRLAAKTSGPGEQWNETLSTVFTYDQGEFQTDHTKCYDPSRDPVTFTNGGMSAGDQVALSQTPGPGSQYRLQCPKVPTGGRGFWTFGNNEDEFSWSLCDGDRIDQLTGIRVLHWQGTDPSCFKVNLIPEKA